MTIATILAAIDTQIREKTSPKSLSTSNHADTLDNVVNELAARGVLRAATTADLANLNATDSSFVYIPDAGIFSYAATTANDVDNSTIFAGSTGFWILAASVLGVQVSGDAGNATILKPDGSLYTPNPISNGVIYGGRVVWLTGYDYYIEATGGYIADILYEAPKTYKSLSVADGTNDRLDAFVLDTANSIQVVEGTPSANPQLPNIALNQLLLNFAIVKAGSTEPDLNVDEIYQENTEWTTASSNSGRINPAATASPITGAKDIEATAPLNTDWITFHRSTPVYAAALNDVLVFTIKPKTGTGIRKLRMSFTLSGTKVGKYVTLKNGSFGYDITSLTAQIIIIPLTSFGLATSQSVDGLKIENQTAGYGWRMDNIMLQKTQVVTHLQPIPEFENNAEAIAGGLLYGEQYSLPLNGDPAIAYMAIVREPIAIPDQNWAIEVTIPEGNLNFVMAYNNPEIAYIHWGDNTISKLTGGDGAAGTKVHKYPAAGVYTINVHGKFINNIGGNAAFVGPDVASGYGNMQKVTATSTINGITGLNSARFLFRSTAITSIPSDLFDNCPGITDFFQTFYGVVGLSSIPVGLFDNCTNALLFDQTFTSTSISSIPTGLFDNCPNVTTVSECFRDCSLLTSIPSGLFDYCPDITSFNSTFYNCTSITSDVPELWVIFPTAVGTACFLNDIAASNYGDIPTDWGGA